MSAHLSGHRRRGAQGSLIRPENYHEELIDIKHYRNWDGPPKYDMYGDD